jgi:hypothetical protein
MVRLHGGSPTKRQGHLNRGTERKPSPYHDARSAAGRLGGQPRRDVWNGHA